MAGKSVAMIQDAAAATPAAPPPHPRDWRRVHASWLRFQGVGWRCRIRLNRCFTVFTDPLGHDKSKFAGGCESARGPRVCSSTDPGQHCRIAPSEHAQRRLGASDRRRIIHTARGRRRHQRERCRNSAPHGPIQAHGLTPPQAAGPSAPATVTGKAGAKAVRSAPIPSLAANWSGITTASALPSRARLRR